MKEQISYLYLHQICLYFKSSFWRPVMKTGWASRIRRRNPFVSPMAHEGRRRWAAQKMRRHDIIPWLSDRMRSIAHAKGVTEPSTISVNMKSGTVQIAPPTCTSTVMMLILIRRAQRFNFLLFFHSRNQRGFLRNIYILRCNRYSYLCRKARKYLDI